MKTPRLMITLFGALAAASLAAGCGDNSAQCGEGTVEVDGICVPDDLVECGAGTTNVGGECVPDGTVICEQGTVFDEDQGACVPSADACAEGTVLVDGQCVPEDETLVADEEEAAEPNDGTDADDVVAGQLAIPAVGESTVIHGCINPYRDLDDNGNPDQDLDLWIVTTTAPALIEVTADGVGGLAAGYQMISATGNDLVDGNFVRFGINLTGDTSSRQIYLPEAGTYGLWMADSRSLFLQDGAAGSPEACYYTTISNVALPAPTAATPNTDIAATHDGDVGFFSADPVDGSFFIATHDMQAAAASSSMWALKNTEVFDQGDAPATLFTGGLADTDAVVYVVDPIYNYALAPVPYTVRVGAPTGGPIPTGGGSIVVNNIDTDWDFFGWFDITTADQMHHFEINADGAVRLIFVDEHGVIISDQDSDLADWVKFPGTGRYHVVIDSSEAAADVPAINVDSEITSLNITPIVPGTLITGAAFNDLGATWHSLDLSYSAWLEFQANSTNWGSDVSLDFFPLGSVGIPANPDGDNSSNFGQSLFMDLPSDGSGSVRRVVLGEGPYLVRVYDYYDELADATSTYDLDLSDRDFTDLDIVTETTPIDQNGLTLEPGASRFFLVRAQGGDRVTLTFTPTDFDASIQFLTATEGNSGAAIDAGAVGVAETAERIVGTQPWIAFRIDNIAGTGNTFDIDVTTESLVPYVSAPGSLAFQDICDDPGAVDITPGSRDDALTAVQTVPFAFSLFGEATTGAYTVSTNGWLALGTPGTTSLPGNTALPTTDTPNGVVAPFWNDLVVDICRLENGSSVTVQWIGEEYWSEAPVQFQVRMFADGHLEYIYGPGHLAAGSGDGSIDAGTTVGLENLGGYYAHLYLYNGAGIVPGSSRVMTPAP